MISFFLAIALQNVIADSAPQIKDRFETREECITERDRLNVIDPDLKLPEAVALGARYICLAVIE